ncbi:MAG: carbamate kinase [Haloferacaceae archaeon]
MGQIVVAMGGNALVEAGRGSIDDQRRRIRRTAPKIAGLASGGYEPILTHGNGPQVGGLLLQNEESGSVETKSLDVLVAESQAQIGYLLQGALGRALGEPLATVVTRTRVDPDDPAFGEPTKRIGPFYDESAAAEKPFPVAEDTDEEGQVGYRRVVPSPAPLEILEIDHVRTLAEAGRPVVCAGGGGIPVVKRGDEFVGREAVVDKDHTSRLLAADLGVDDLLFLTDVDAAYRNFGTEAQQRLDRITAEEAAELLESGEFGEGSMAPKVAAAVDFLEAGGERAIVTSVDAVVEAVDGEAGTTIVPSGDG